MADRFTRPADFRYQDVLDRGYPEHRWNDPFRLRHPSMEQGRRAKLFAPFDALKGFDEALSAKDEIYVEPKTPDPERQEELNRRLSILRDLTADSRLARENRVPVSVTYYVPCADRESEFFGRRGKYEVMEGTVRRVSADGLVLNNSLIPLEDIADLTSPRLITDPRTGRMHGLFDPPGEEIP